jgi:Dolichyl-phosphate-mannose-protein mannosyltransferase
MTRRPALALTHSWVYWSALAVGVAVRVTGLFGQLLAGDEMHAFRFVREHSLAQSLATYSNTANSPPINVWLRAFVAFGWPPSELALRIPVLLCGLALLWWAPRWIERHFDRPIAIAATWLLAVSPLLVFYSRFMRPYMPYALVATVAAAAFFDWWRERRLRPGLIYAVCGAFAVYLHLLAALFVVAPWAFLALEALLGGRRTLPPWRHILTVGGAFGALVLAFVAPGWRSIETLIVIRQQPIRLEPQDFIGAVARLSGPYTGSGTVVLVLLAVYGAAVWWRRDAALTRFGMILILLPYGALPLLSPRYIANGIIYSRYLLPLTVPLLTAAAIGLTTSLWGERSRVWRWAGVGVCLFLVFDGPIADPDMYFNPAGVRPEILVARYRKALPREKVPALYLRLADGPPGAVVEAPAQAVDVYLSRLAEYHRTHGRPVRIAGDSELADRTLGLRSVVPLEPAALLAGDAAFIVIHRDWSEELGDRAGAPRSAPKSLRRLIHQRHGELKRDGEAFIGRARRAWGPPDLADTTLVIWNLERLRGAARRP